MGKETQAVKLSDRLEANSQISQTYLEEKRKANNKDIETFDPLYQNYENKTYIVIRWNNPFNEIQTF